MTDSSSGYIHHFTPSDSPVRREKVYYRTGFKAALGLAHFPHPPAPLDESRATENDAHLLQATEAAWRP